MPFFPPLDTVSAIPGVIIKNYSVIEYIYNINEEKNRPLPP